MKVNKDNEELSDEQIKEIEDKSGLTPEQIDAASKLQEQETEKHAQHILAYQRYNDLAQVIRLLLGCMKKLNSTGNKNKISYWSNAVNHWATQTGKVLDNKELFDPPLTKQLLDELENNVRKLRGLKTMLKPNVDAGEVDLVVDDLLYRLNAMYGSLVSLDGIKQYAIEKRHSDLVEYIQNRIKVLSDRVENPTAIETGESLGQCIVTIEELKGLIYHDNQSKDDVK